MLLLVFLYLCMLLSRNLFLILEEHSWSDNLSFSQKVFLMSDFHSDNTAQKTQTRSCLGNHTGIPSFLNNTGGSCSEKEMSVMELQIWE